jgi:hypothetical protein
MVFPYVEFKSIGIIPPAFLRERHILIDNTRAWLDHQRHRLLEPLLEMTRLTVDRPICLGFKHLDEREARRIVNLLQDIEPHASILLLACLGVLERYLPESFHVLHLDVTVNQDNIHKSSFLRIGKLMNKNTGDSHFSN